MKVVLGIFCGLMALFAGGCALILFTGSGYNGMFESLPGAVIFGGIALLNMLVLMALFGKRKPQRWVFYTLAVLDAAVVVILAFIWSDFGFEDSDTNLLGAILVGGFALKGILTVLFSRKL
jgi:hypothetical protein